VALGKTFIALAVINYHERCNRSVLALSLKKLAYNSLTFNHNLKTNLFAKDRFSHDVLCHARLEQKTAKQRELAKKAAQRAKERQFIRKVAINADLRRLQLELTTLRRAV